MDVVEGEWLVWGERGGSEAGGAMTDASTVGWFQDCIDLVLWLLDEMVIWI